LNRLEQLIRALQAETRQPKTSGSEKVNNEGGEKNLTDTPDNIPGGNEIMSQGHLPKNRLVECSKD